MEYDKLLQCLKCIEYKLSWKGLNELTQEVCGDEPMWNFYKI